jgi:hypothetical protein
MFKLLKLFRYLRRIIPLEKETNAQAGNTDKGLLVYLCHKEPCYERHSE